LRLFSFGGYALALAPLALVLFGAYDSYPFQAMNYTSKIKSKIPPYYVLRFVDKLRHQA